MQSQEWIGLAGVAVGGCLTYLTQFSTARLTSKNEDKRREDQRSEQRRQEQLDLLREFTGIAAQGARIAEHREFSNEWDEAGEWVAADRAEWRAEARSMVDRLFVAERMIQIQMSEDLHQRAWDYAIAVDKVLWRSRAEIEAEGELWEVLQQPARAFFAAAREAIF